MERITEAAAEGVLCKKVFLKMSQISQVFSYEICEILKDTFFRERLRTTASRINTKKEHSYYSSVFKVLRELSYLNVTDSFIMILFCYLFILP